MFQVMPLLKQVQVAGNKWSDRQAEDCETLLAMVKGCSLGSETKRNVLVEQVDQAINKSIVDNQKYPDGLGELKAKGPGKNDCE